MSSHRAAAGPARDTRRRARERDESRPSRGPSEESDVDATSSVVRAVSTPWTRATAGREGTAEAVWWRAGWGSIESFP